MYTHFEFLFKLLNKTILENFIGKFACTFQNRSIFCLHLIYKIINN